MQKIEGKVGDARVHSILVVMWRKDEEVMGSVSGRVGRPDAKTRAPLEGIRKCRGYEDR